MSVTIQHQQQCLEDPSTLATRTEAAQSALDSARLIETMLHPYAATLLIRPDCMGGTTSAAHAAANPTSLAASPLSGLGFVIDLGLGAHETSALEQATLERQWQARYMEPFNRDVTEYQDESDLLEEAGSWVWPDTPRSGSIGSGQAYADSVYGSGESEEEYESDGAGDGHGSSIIGGGSASGVNGGQRTGSGIGRNQHQHHRGLGEADDDRLSTMARRAATILSFKHVRIVEIFVQLSFRGSSGVDSFDGLEVKLHTHVYHSLTCSIEKLLKIIRKDVIKDVLGQAGRNLSNIGMYFRNKFGQHSKQSLKARVKAVRQGDSPHDRNNEHELFSRLLADWDKTPLVQPKSVRGMREYVRRGGNVKDLDTAVAASVLLGGSRRIRAAAAGGAGPREPKPKGFKARLKGLFRRKSTKHPPTLDEADEARDSQHDSSMDSALSALVAMDGAQDERSRSGGGRP